MKSALAKQEKGHILCIGAIVFLLSCTVISIIILAAVPPVSKDALTHQLAVPKLYLNDGGIHEILHGFFLLPHESGSALFNYFVLRKRHCSQIHSFLFRSAHGLTHSRLFEASTQSGLCLFWGSFFLSIPIIVKLSITVYVDLGPIFFSTANLLALLKWI